MEMQLNTSYSTTEFDSLH